MNANTPEGSRIKVVTTLLLLLLVVTVVVIQMIQKADTAGKSISGGMGQMPPAAVIVITVELEKTRERIKATGFLKALSRSDVATQETGAVLEMPVDEGDEVQKGDTLAILDSRRIRAQIVEGKARLTTARNAAYSAGAVAVLETPLTQSVFDENWESMMGDIPPAPGLADLDELYPMVGRTLLCE